MTRLALYAAAAGLTHGALGAAGLARGEALRRGLAAFPRSRIPAWVLCAVDLAWVVWVIHGAALGRFEGLKPLVYVAGPLAFVLLVGFLDELLAPRALGGLLLLFANPVLAAARWHPGAVSRLVSALAYVWVVAGMYLVLSPFTFRRAVTWLARTAGRWTVASAALAAIGATLLVLAFTVF